MLGFSFFLSFSLRVYKELIGEEEKKRNHEADFSTGTSVTVAEKKLCYFVGAAL